jgi:hypothetical protein
MLKLIAILVLSSTLSVAVETDNGYVEGIFPNTSAGAQQLIEFVEKTVGEPEGGVRIVVGAASEQVNENHMLNALADLGIGNGRVSPEELEAVVRESQLPEPTAKAVVLADEKKFGFLYRKKKK